MAHLSLPHPPCASSIAIWGISHAGCNQTSSTRLDVAWQVPNLAQLFCRRDGASMQQCSPALTKALDVLLMQAPSHALRLEASVLTASPRPPVLGPLCQEPLADALQGPSEPATPLPGQLPPSDLAAPVDDASDSASSSDVASLEEIRAVIADMDRDDTLGRDAAAE